MRTRDAGQNIRSQRTPSALSPIGHVGACGGHLRKLYDRVDAAHTIGSGRLRALVTGYLMTLRCSRRMRSAITASRAAIPLPFKTAVSSAASGSSENAFGPSYAPVHNLCVPSSFGCSKTQMTSSKPVVKVRHNNAGGGREGTQWLD